MNPCVVTVEVFGEESSFEVSSHEYAVSITDPFNRHPYLCSFPEVRHTQGFAFCFPPPVAIDTDIDHEVDYSYHETFGASHGWL